MNEDIDQEAPEVNEAEHREAKSLGWAPREKWRGNEDEFVDAPEFLRRARQHLPVVNARLKQEQEARRREKADFDARAADFDRRLKAQEKTNQRALDLQKQQLFDQFEEEKRRALTIEDPAARTRAYDSATRRERDAATRLAREEEPASQPTQAQPRQPQQQQETQVVPEAVEWGKKNPWFWQNKSLADEASAIFDQTRQEEPHLTVTDALEKVTDQIKDRYPAWFPPKPNGNPTPTPQRRATAVEGGGAMSRGSGSNSKAKGFQQLPAESKASFEKMLERGYLRPKAGEDPEKAKPRLQKEYAENYWSDYDE